MKLSADTIASLEAIAFQNGSLYKEITSVFEALKKEGYKSPAQLTNSPLDKIVFKYTGINVVSMFEEDCYDIYCISPRLTTNNVLISNFRRSLKRSTEGLSYIKSARKSLEGSVDLINGRVGGVFSQCQCTAFIDPVFVFEDPKDEYTPKFTAEELAGIYLHEIGHLFTYFEFLTESVSTNQVLAYVSKRLLETADMEERKIQLKEIEHDLEITIADKEALSKTENLSAIYTVLLSARVDALRSSTGSSVYDIKSWEQLADQFAVRHGAGRALITGLYKLEDPIKNKYVRRAASLYHSAMCLLGTVFIMAVWPTAGSIAVMSIFLLMSRMDNSLHDNPEQRFNRIKHDTIEALKNPNLSKERKDGLLDDLEVIDSLIKDIVTNRHMFDVIWDYIRPARRDARKQYLLQIELEKLAANSLFVQAAKLSSIA